MSDDTAYAGLSILTMGDWIEKAQRVGYVGRVGLMALGFMVIEFLIAMNMDADEIFGAINMFSGKVLDGGEGVESKVFAIFLAFFVCHAFAFFILGWKKFKKTLDGDLVARELFDDVNHVHTKDEARS